MMAALTQQDNTFTPPPPSTKFELPGLDESLTPEAQKKKAAAEAAGQTFTPGENDFVDSGPYGYLHKKGIHDALMALHDEMQANAPHIDYHGILNQRLQDIAAMPPEHHTNPLMLFAMAMGNPEHAREMIQQHNADEQSANDTQTQRWQKLLDMKQQALEGAIKQSMAEGDARKVVSGKWLETLAQIEQDKAHLQGQLQLGSEKNAAALQRANMRGQWALEAVKARVTGMLHGTTADTKLQQTLITESGTMARALIKKGVEPEDAFQEAQDWAEQRMTDLGITRGAAPAKAGAAVGGAGGGGAVNPLQARILRNRGHNAPAPVTPPTQ
jgi:hypothetical protein